MLKHGTGLLLDLGGQVTVTSVRIDLTKYRGASLQIKVGNGTAPQDLRVAATAEQRRRRGPADAAATRRRPGTC